MRIKKILLWLPIIILILLTGIIQINTSDVGANATVITTPVTVSEIQAHQLQDALAKESDPDTVKALQEKLEPVEKMLKLQATAQSLPTPSLKEICENRILEISPKTIPEMGIFAVREDFLATQNLKINNIFRGLYQDQIVEIYAGHEYPDDQKGLIIVSIESLGVYEYFFDPTPAGTLEIVSENNLRLELKTGSGDIRFFDIPSMQFISSADTVVKSIILPPTPTPFIDPCAQFDQP
ncbi:MAG: hypothetical protein CVU46_03485 [Chloroflexi bacterium HGW-Chloroflexi-8]|jgi:hypothetical protein|nr:MAG: hypothetical protein CVU46_03485 [Chloroflexi bacterium HGW-Chloroflexi-8]